MAATTATPPVTRRLEDLPGPRGIPLLGNLLQIDPPRMHRQLEQWCDEFGPYFSLRLGRRRMLVVGEHGAVGTMLRDRPDGFRRPPRLQVVAEEMGLKRGLFGAEGEDWKRQRRMVMAGFDPAHVKGYFPSLQMVAERLHRRWQGAARHGTAIDLQADLMRYTVDTIAGLAFGAEVKTLESDGDVIQQHLDQIFPALHKRMLAPLPTWRFFPSAADRRLARGVLAVNAAVDGFIAEARARMAVDPGLRSHPRNLLEAMIAAADEPASGISDRQVAGNVLTMLLAGEDTTANTIAWMIDALWRNPDKLARATLEVRRAVDADATPSFEQLEQLDYLEACAHETMRQKPVAPVIGLLATREQTVGDIRIPAGTLVINVMRRDSVSERWVPNAAVFEPERWLAGDGPAAMASSAKRTSMPFGAGPRICPGRYLALLEMKMAMATLLGRFDISSVQTPDGLPAREHLSFTMTPVGLRMRLTERAMAAESAPESMPQY